jgi:hypothetical protein
MNKALVKQPKGRTEGTQFLLFAADFMFQLTREEFKDPPSLLFSSWDLRSPHE